MDSRRIEWKDKKGGIQELIIERSRKEEFKIERIKVF